MLMLPPFAFLLSLLKLLNIQTGDRLHSWMSMTLQMGMRTKEPNVAWNHFNRLCQSGLCRMMAMTMRPHRMGRGALAQVIQKMLAGESGP